MHKWLMIAYVMTVRRVDTVLYHNNGWKCLSMLSCQKEKPRGTSRGPHSPRRVPLLEPNHRPSYMHNTLTLLSCEQKMDTCSAFVYITML